MRAAAFFEYGPAEVLRYAEVPDPALVEAGPVARWPGRWTIRPARTPRA